MLKQYGVTIGLITIANGLVKQIVFSQGNELRHYFVAISISLLLAMLAAVILAVYWERPWQAPAFVLLAGGCNALIYYQAELRSGYLPLATQLVTAVALAVWLVASVADRLRRRLWALD